MIKYTSGVKTVVTKGIIPLYSHCAIQHTCFESITFFIKACMQVEWFTEGVYLQFTMQFTKGSPASFPPHPCIQCRQQNYMMTLVRDFFQLTQCSEVR